MPISFAKKTRKNYKLKHEENKHKDAKNATQVKCLIKTCRANKYKSVYGSTGGNIRANRALFH